MRATLDRQWTATEYDLAKWISDAVASWGGARTGAVAVARAVGLPLGRRYRDRTLRRIYDVMPLAVILTPDRHPGQALLVDPVDNTYVVTDDHRTAKRVASDRLKKVHTVVARVSAEVAPLRGADDLGSIMAVKMLEQVVAGLDPIVWDAIIAESVEVP